MLLSSRVLLFGESKRGRAIFVVPLRTLKAKGGMPYDYIGNSIVFPDDLALLALLIGVVNVMDDRKGMILMGQTRKKHFKNEKK